MEKNKADKYLASIEEYVGRSARTLRSFAYRTVPNVNSLSTYCGEYVGYLTAR
jgi:hypothetical protein